MVRIWKSPCGKAPPYDGSGVKSRRFLSVPAVAAQALLLTAAVLTTACDKQQAPASPNASSTSSAPTPPPPVGETGSPEPEPTVPLAGSSLEVYKNSIHDIKVFMEEHQGETDSVKALEHLRSLVTRISAIKTDGLPTDLATSFATVRDAMQRIQTAFDALPVPVDQFEKWMADQATKGETAVAEAKKKMDTFVETMTAIQKEIEPASKKMNEVGAHYGIDPLDLNSQ